MQWIMKPLPFLDQAFILVQTQILLVDEIIDRYENENKLECNCNSAVNIVICIW
jgi:hypothetical protein